MKKIFAVTIILISAILLQNKFTQSAEAFSINFNNPSKSSDNFNFFNDLFKGKKKFQEKIGNNNFGNNFMIKGVISSSSSNSITINNQDINIDSSITGDVKITGSIQNGAYAMVKGLIKDSNYYATRIVIDQRNKKDLEDENNDEDNNNVSPTPTATVSPTITLTPTPTATVSPTVTPTSSESAILDESEKGGVKESLNMNTFLEALHNFLNSVRQFVLSV